MRLLSGQTVTAEGQFGSLRDLRLDPPPVQRPRPPLRVRRPRSRAGRREAVQSVSRIYAQDFDPLAGRYLLHGDPDMVAARPAEYHAAGAGAVIFPAACPPDRRPAVTELFARAVLPRLTRHINHGVAR